MHYSNDADAVVSVNREPDGRFAVAFGDGEKTIVDAPSAEVAAHYANPRYCPRPCPVDQEGMYEVRNHDTRRVRNAL